MGGEQSENHTCYDKSAVFIHGGPFKTLDEITVISIVSLSLAEIFNNIFNRKIVYRDLWANGGARPFRSGAGQ